MKRERIRLEAQAKKLRFPISALEAARAWNVSIPDTRQRFHRLVVRGMITTIKNPECSRVLYVPTEKFWAEWFDH